MINKNSITQAWQQWASNSSQSPFGKTSSVFENPMSEYLSSGFSDIGNMGLKQNTSLGEVSQRPIDATNAQNTAQRADSSSNSLMDAWNSIQSMYREGVPVVGTSDLRVKRDAYGRPFTVVSMTPTDDRGMPQNKDTMSFGISPEMKQSQQIQPQRPQQTANDGSVDETRNMPAPANNGRQYMSTEYKSSFAPFADQNAQQNAEYQRRKQLSMSGRGSAI